MAITSRCVWQLDVCKSILWILQSYICEKSRFPSLALNKMTLRFEQIPVVKIQLWKIFSGLLLQRIKTWSLIEWPVSVNTGIMAALFAVCTSLVVSLKHAELIRGKFTRHSWSSEMWRLTLAGLLNFHTLLTAISSGANVQRCVPSGTGACLLVYVDVCVCVCVCVCSHWNDIHLHLWRFCPDLFHPFTRSKESWLLV